MTQPPGPPGDRPDDEPPRPGFEPPYVPPAAEWPRTDPPPVPPHESNLKPPWRIAAPEEKEKYLGFMVLGIVVPWVMVAVAVLFMIFGGDLIDQSDAIGIGVLLLLATAVVDFAGLIVAFTVPNHTVRSLGWGVLIALLTHLIAAAIGVLVLFGLCISVLNAES